MCAHPFTGFPLGVRTKKGHYKKSQRSYISPIGGEFPTQPNSTKIGIWVGVPDVINHTKFGNDRSKDYKVTEGQILAFIHVGVGESKYEVTGDPLLRGHVTQPNFGPKPAHNGLNNGDAHLQTTLNRHRSPMKVV